MAKKKNRYNEVTIIQKGKIPDLNVKKLKAMDLLNHMELVGYQVYYQRRGRVDCGIKKQGLEIIITQDYQCNQLEACQIESKDVFLLLTYSNLIISSRHYSCYSYFDTRMITVFFCL